jgi:hypothetical protein
LRSRTTRLRGTPRLRRDQNIYPRAYQECAQSKPRYRAAEFRNFLSRYQGKEVQNGVCDDRYGCARYPPAFRISFCPAAYCFRSGLGFPLHLNRSSVAFRNHSKLEKKPVTILITSGSARLNAILTLNIWLAKPARSIAAAARAFFRRLLAGLEESRRRQAALVIARYSDLIADPEIAARFNTKPKNQK